MVYRTRQTLFVRSVERLLEVIVDDTVGDPSVQYATARALCERPPFSAGMDPAQTTIYSLNTPELAQALWNAIRDVNSTVVVDLTDIEVSRRLFFLKSQDFRHRR